MNYKDYLEVIILTPNKDGVIKPQGTKGFETPEGKLKIGKNIILDYPNPTQLINGCLYLMQTSKNQFIPITLGIKETMTSDMIKLLDKIQNKETLVQDDYDAILSYLSTNKLIPEADNAFANIYAENVEGLILSSLANKTSIWDKLSKVFPFLIPIVAVILVAVFLYALNNNLAATQHLLSLNQTQVACQYIINNNSVATKVVGLGVNGTG